MNETWRLPRRSHRGDIWVSFAWQALRQVVARLELRVSKARLRRGSLRVEYNSDCLPVSSKPLKPLTQSGL